MSGALEQAQVLIRQAQNAEADALKAGDRRKAELAHQRKDFVQDLVDHNNIYEGHPVVIPENLRDAPAENKANVPSETRPPSEIRGSDGLTDEEHYGGGDPSWGRW